MIRRNNQSSGRKPKNNNKQSKEVSASTMVYKGPVIKKDELQSSDLHTQVLVYDIQLSSTGTGTIVAVFPFESPASAVDWSSAVALYDEYRTLAMEIDYVPNSEDCLSPTNNTNMYFPVYSVIDRDSNAALTSYSVATQYASCVPHTLTKKWRVKMNMEGLSVGNATGSSIVTGEGLWLNCAEPPSVCGSIKLFASGLTNSVAYGRIIIRYRVQFRGRGI